MTGNILEKIKSYVQSGRLPDGTELHSSVNLNELTALNSAVLELKPSATLEIGLAYGISALAIACVSKEHHAIDPYQTSYWKSVGVKTLSEHGLKVHVHDKYPEEVFNDLPKVGFAFIDGSHLFDLTIFDFVLVDKKLEVGGVVALHDLWMPSVRKAVRYILANRDYEIWSPKTFQWNFKEFSLGTLIKSAMALVRVIPGFRSIFAPEVIKPWHQIFQGNMIFLRKKSEDKRDWKKHELF